jgi:ABC-type lipoprotein release transport system permease subunit
MPVMITSLSWRNVWRSRTRSLVIIIATAIGIFAGVFVWAFYRGMVVQRVKTAIITESSHIQIHHADYLTNPIRNISFQTATAFREQLPACRE